MQPKLKNPCTIFIVRHGETEWNTEHRIQGHQDSPLTKKGIKQARTTGRLLHDIEFDALYSSDLLRAKRTAEIIAAEKKLTVKTTQLLRERSFGKLEGTLFKEVKHYFDKVYDHPPSKRLEVPIHPEIEPTPELISRFITFIRQAALTHPNQTILTVTHGGTIRTLLMHLGYLKADRSGAHTVSNASYVKLLTDGTDFVIGETYGIHRKR